METVVPPGFVSEEDYQKLVTKYEQLHKRYRYLEEKHSKCGPFIKRAHEKYEAAKENARQWQAWYDRRKASKQGRLKQRNLESAANPSGDRTCEKSSSLRITSSQTTEGEVETSLPGHDNVSSDDELEVVSCRVVRHGRTNSAGKMPPPRVKQEPTTQSNPIELISDVSSSPALKRQQPLRMETSDLGALVEHLNTPRKRKRRRATSEEIARPAALLATMSSLSEGDAPEADVRKLAVSLEPQARNRPVVEASDFADSVVKRTSGTNALQQLSTNAPSGTGRKRKHGNFRSNVAILSEDGDDEISQALAARPEIPPKTIASLRLETLLDAPSPERQPLPVRRTPEMPMPRSRKHATPQTAKKVGAAKDPPQRQQQSRPVFQRPHGLEKSPPPMRPEDEPLRIRALDTLHLDDFRINPKYLGADYAFADTLRGRDARRNLHGYTKPEFSSDVFQKAIEIGGGHGAKSDAQVLEDYLGPNWHVMLGAYAPDKRKDLLMQARSHALANQHGKHRQAFERRSTPPGFWRTDMPTTQEEHQDRAKAHRLEREKVEERWREAMRDGGRWLFKDE